MSRPAGAGAPGRLTGDGRSTVLSVREAPVVLAGSGNRLLAREVANELNLELAPVVLERFPDDELHVELLADVRRRDVYLVQSLPPPADRSLFELLFLADACVRAAASRVTAVIPYLAYARQDRRVTGREPLGARIVANLLENAGIQQVVALDLHNLAVEGCFHIPVEHVSAIDLLAERVGPSVGSPAVVVSPDFGGVKRAERYAARLGAPVVVVHKSRVTGTEVTVQGVVGDIRGCSPVIVDDMIATAATLVAAVGAIAAAGCSQPVVVAATHGLFVGDAVERLRHLAVRALFTTDSVPLRTPLPVSFEVVSVAPLLADAIRRLHA